MIKAYKRIVLAIFMILIFSLSISVHAQPKTSSITDSSDDVTLVRTKQGNNGQPNVYTETVSSMPNIDITSASYTANANGSVSISLTVKGNIESDNKTYYSIELIGNYLSSTRAYLFDIQIYYTTLFVIATNAIVPNVQYSYRNGSLSGYGPMNSYVTGSTLITTLEPNITSATNDNFSVVLPTSFPENEVNNNLNTTWHIISHYGNSTIPFDQYGGDQFFDYYPNSDNQYLVGITHISPTPGFEFISIIITFPIILSLKKKLKI